MSNSSKIHIGRRKSAVALVNFVKGKGDFVINKKNGFTYLQQDPFAIQTVIAPLKFINLEKKYDVICSVRGGGICAQAEAIQLGVARALCSLNSTGSEPHLVVSPRKAALSSLEQDNLNSAFPSQNLEGESRSLLKEAGYLRRDSRIKERRKYGLKKARKAEQYSKR